MSRISVKGIAKVETVYETIRLLKFLGLDEEVIREEVRRSHGLDEVQACQALWEYRKMETEKERYEI